VTYSEANILNHNFDFKVGANHLLEIKGLAITDRNFINEIKLPVTIGNECAELFYNRVGIISVDDTIIVDAILCHVEYMGNSNNQINQRG
jgi:hypothetical protein